MEITTCPAPSTNTKGAPKLTILTRVQRHPTKCKEGAYYFHHICLSLMVLAFSRIQSSSTPFPCFLEVNVTKREQEMACFILRVEYKGDSAVLNSN